MKAQLLAWVLVLTVGCSAINRLGDKHFDELCDNEADDDDDGWVDCRDPDCKEDEYCTEDTAEECADGKDNDLDAHTDCEDEGCGGAEHCTEDTAVECADGEDNDGNGRTDCDEDACTLWLNCFPIRTLVPVAGCPPGAPAQMLRDSFLGQEIDERQWGVFHTRQHDRPRLTDDTGEEAGCGSGDDCLFDPHAWDDWNSSGIVSKEAFRVGRDHPFSLKAALRFVAPCDAGCRLRFHLHTRGTWGDSVTGGHEVLRVDFGDVEGHPEQLNVSCRYHGRGVEPDGDGLLQLSHAGHHELSLAQDGTGQAALKIDSEDFCRWTELAPSEPEAYLVIDQYYLPAEPLGHALVDSMSLEVEPQQGMDGCAHLRQALFEDQFCTAAFYNSGTDEGRGPEVAFQPADDGGGYHLLFMGLHNQNHTDIGYAFSPDGRMGWTPAMPGEQLVSECSFGVNHVLQALVFNEETSRLEAWIEESAPGRRLLRLLHADPDGPPVFSPVGPVELAEAVEEGTHEPGPWLPDTVLRRQGSYEAWFAGPVAGDGRWAIWRAVSEDGLLWQPEPPHPVLRFGEVGDWDREGAFAPSVSWAGHLYVMAYRAEPFGDPPAIGLAVSPDGIDWTKHQDNPVLRGEPGGIDEGGVRDPCLRVEDGLIRLWYTAVTYQTLTCPVEEQSIGVQRRLSYAELRFAPSDPAP